MPERAEPTLPGFSKALDALRRPGFYAERARWKARRFAAALRKTWIGAPPAVRACNRRAETLDYGPLNIYLETASGCNLRCPMCPTGAGRVSRRHGLMDPALAEKLVREIRHRPEQVGLWLGGEPLLNPRLGRIVRILAEAGLPTGVHTNAALLTPERSEELLRAGLGFISFSFDAADPETYARMRPGADFDAILANVRGFIDAKRRLGAETRVIVQTVVPYENEETHPYGVALETPAEIRALFDGLPVDWFHAVIAHAWSGALDGEAMVAPNHAGLGRRMACLVPYTDLVIAWNGEVVACCGDLDAQGVLGDFHREELYALWNNERFRALRRAMHSAEIERHPLCGRCERIWTQPHPLDYELRLALLRYRLRL